MRHLLFIDALSGSIGDAHYEQLEVQQAITQRLILPLDVVKQFWVVVDMTNVRAMDPSGQGRMLPTVAESFQALFTDSDLTRRFPANQLYAVVVVPAIGHQSALRAVYKEAMLLTEHDSAAVIVMWQEGESPVQLLDIIPEPEHDDAFREALQQAQQGQTC